MEIRNAAVADIPQIMQIFSEAREYMASSGNPDQWSENYPAQSMIEADIRRQTSFVCVENSAILATFYFAIETEPTYATIQGNWLNNNPYGVIHRIARVSDNAAKNVGALVFNWCFEQIHNIRIDTHRDNKTMIDLLDRLGYTYCGIIHIATGAERLAFQKI
ncbi:MAG: N-acetyltransferase [Turicibacter sp.]|nr:N-acetyltransferase [Turicibacter sp.]